MLNRETVYLGGGCFWCIEAIFLKLKGVRSITPGYIGGVSKNPTYEEICKGNSGHAEAIKCDFDDKIISSKALSKQQSGPWYAYFRSNFL